MPKSRAKSQVNPDTSSLWPLLGRVKRVMVCKSHLVFFRRLGFFRLFGLVLGCGTEPQGALIAPRTVICDLDVRKKPLGPRRCPLRAIGILKLHGLNSRWIAKSVRH